jgi:hypothetical protein
VRVVREPRSSFFRGRWFSELDMRALRTRARLFRGAPPRCEKQVDYLSRVGRTHLQVGKRQSAFAAWGLVSVSRYSRLPGSHVANYRFCGDAAVRRRSGSRSQRRRFNPPHRLCGARVLVGQFEDNREIQFENNMEIHYENRSPSLNRRSSHSYRPRSASNCAVVTSRLTNCRG